MKSFWDSSVEILWLRDREGKEGRRRGAGGKHENGRHERGKEEKEKEDVHAESQDVYNTKILHL